MVRHFRTELAKAILEGFPIEKDEALRRACYEQFVELAREFCNDRVLFALPVRERVIIYLLLQDRYEDLCAVSEVLSREFRARAISESGRLFIAHEGFRDSRRGIPDEIYAVGVRSCIQASVIAAEEHEDDLMLRFSVRVLVTNTPTSIESVVLVKPATRESEVVARIDDAEKSEADVPLIEFAVSARQFAAALESGVTGRWSVMARMRVGEATLDVPVHFLESAKRCVDLYQARTDRGRVATQRLGWGRRFQFERTDRGRLSVRSVIPSRLRKLLWHARLLISRVIGFSAGRS
jgi:hypothetical protein